jgi:hypothetical protein
MLSHFPEKYKLLRCVTTQSSQRPQSGPNRPTAAVATLFTLCGHSDGIGRWQSHRILTLSAPAATISYPATQEVNCIRPTGRAAPLRPSGLACRSRR